MRVIISIIYFVTLVVLLLNIMGVHKSKKKIAVYVERMLTVAAIMTAANLVTVVSDTELICSFAYSVFFSGMTWLLYLFFAFIRVYTGFGESKYYNDKLMLVVVYVDSVMIYLNLFFGHVFLCRETFSLSGERFYQVSHGFWYGVHLIFCYMLAVFCILCLLYRMADTPKLYRKKYAVVLAVIACILTADTVYTIYSTIFESTVIFFAIGGLAIYYYAIVFEPKGLKRRTLNMVVNNMTGAVVTFDIDGNCIQMNERAGKIIGLSKEEINMSELVRKLHGNEEIDFSKNHTFHWTIQKNNRDMNYKIQYQRIEDNKNCYLGCFFVIEDETEMVEKLHREHYYATHDRVTGIYNKEFFYEQAGKCLEKNVSEEMIMVCSDVKNFKLVNDVLGTEAGDRLLKKIADGVREKAKPYQIYGRLESDRFALLMKKKDFGEDYFLDETKALLHDEVDISYPVQIYVGVYEITEEKIPVSIMCARALMAANSIKGNVQKRVAFYDDELRKRALNEHEMINGLEYALETEQFQIYLQPQVDAAGNVSGAEALVRWIHPEKGMIPPGNFLPVLERNGLIVKLDCYVWEQACKCLKRWKEHGNTLTYISINISPIDIYFMDIYKVLETLIHKYEINPKNLKIEITESAFIKNLEKLQKLLKKLRNAGFFVEMDDFGSGYSSLNMLKNIEVDALKLDMAFLGETDNEERSRKILSAVVHMSKELELPVITEGVETEEQVKFLKQIGCNMFQGYYFAKPMEVGRFEESYL